MVLAKVFERAVPVEGGASRQLVETGKQREERKETTYSYVHQPSSWRRRNEGKAGGREKALMSELGKYKSIRKPPINTAAE